MSWGQFEWLKKVKTLRYAEISQHLQNEIIFKDNKIRSKGFLVTEANAE